MTVIVNQYYKKTQTWQQLLITIIIVVWCWVRFGRRHPNSPWTTSSGNNPTASCAASVPGCKSGGEHNWHHAHDTTHIVCLRQSGHSWPVWVFGLGPSHRLVLGSKSRYRYVSDRVLDYILLVFYSALIQTNYHWIGIGQKMSIKYITPLKR